MLYPYHAKPVSHLASVVVEYILRFYATMEEIEKSSRFAEEIFAKKLGS